MTQKLLFAALISMFSSCKQSAIEKKLKGCDSLVITFSNEQTKSVIREVTTSETKAIQKLARFLRGAETPVYQCGYDGNMQFFKAGRQVLPVLFKYSETGCRSFMFDLDNKTITTKMGHEAANFLRSLAEGKNWY